MDQKKYKTKEEIAKEFDNLPERKSKIASIMKEEDENLAYCICRSSDSSRFMICCDNCEEWYHGDCIMITEKEAKSIKKYYCDRCRKGNPSMTTVFKATTTNSSTSRDYSNHHLMKDIIKKKKDKDSRCGNCDGCRSKMMGKKGKCEKRSSKKIKRNEKNKDTRVK